MNSGEKRVALVTGASSGIGEACANTLLRRGYRVFGASRRFTALPSSNFVSIPMDVSSKESVEAAVANLLAQEGQVDLLINNAGYSLVGAVEDTTDEEIRAQLETNLLGPWRVCRAVLPTMRAQARGCIINIGSIGGRIGLPFQAAYSASKFGLSGFTEALSAEVTAWSIRVVLIELGNYRTAITQHRQIAAGATGVSAYSRRFDRATHVIAAAEETAQLPEQVATLVAIIAERALPRLLYRAGPLLERIAPIAKAMLPGRLFERLLMSHYS